MEKPKVTPKDFFLWFAAMLALYVSVFSFIELFFDYINHAFPDPLEGYSDPYSASIRFAIASLVVLFPVFLILMRLIRNDIMKMPEKAELWVRRWALFLTLFLAGTTIVVDLVTLVNTYLNGDVTVRFFLKVVVVFLVAGAGFLHFLADLKGYWQQHPSYSKMVMWGAALAVAVSVIGGIFIIGTPGTVRLYRFDDQKVSDLQNIQWQVVNYWQHHGTLPESLSALNDPLSGFTVPVDAQSGASYRYELLSGHSFQLCATFNAETQPGSLYANRLTVPAPAGSGKDLAAESWQHSSGETCFPRTIDPAEYPVLK
jgi:hypothetical protein